MKKTWAETLGLYLHIPFCVQKCRYCDFRSFGGTGQGEQERYFSALCDEIRGYKNEESSKEEELININKYYVDSIFFGGGTPSLPEAGLIGRALDEMRNVFSVEGDAEITLEANPGTLSTEKLRAFRSMGINRLSMGVQSMDPQILAILGRIHSPEDVLENFRQAREAGFDNINIDLMFGIPGQSFESFEDTAQKILALKPEHLSFYSLQIEEGTPFYKGVQRGELRQPSQELDRRMYHRMRGLLSECDYKHYEISNGAREGYFCRHNLKYWSMEDYLGLGLAAHSYIKGVRFYNTSDMERYLSGDHLADVCQNDRDDSISDYLFTELRRIRGISLEDFERRYGEPLIELCGAQIGRFCGEGLLEMTDEWLCFTEKGLDFTNTVLRELMRGRD